jgi:tetratricopeptide repeat protein 30
MQGPPRYLDAIVHYETILSDFLGDGDLLRAETIVLANLCVCYIVTKQQLKAEQLIAELER